MAEVNGKYEYRYVRYWPENERHGTVYGLPTTEERALDEHEFIQSLEYAQRHGVIAAVERRWVHEWEEVTRATCVEPPATPVPVKAKRQRKAKASPRALPPGE